MVRKLGFALIAASAVLFAYAFLRTAGAGSGSCSGSECLQGEARWGVILVGSVFAFVTGFLMVKFGGAGYGKTHGPDSFAEVDSGAWAPRQREPSDTPTRPPGRWSRAWRNIYLLTGLFEVGLAALFALATVLGDARPSAFLPTAAILGAVGAIFLVLGWRAAQKDRLHETGLDGEGTIAGIEQTGMWMNDQAYVRLDLIVRVPGHQPYEVKHGEIVPQVALGRLTNGSTLRLKVDPERPSHLLVQWERL
jgi:hypothetical protein